MFRNVSQSLRQPLVVIVLFLFCLLSLSLFSCYNWIVLENCWVFFVDWILMSQFSPIIMMFIQECLIIVCWGMAHFHTNSRLCDTIWPFENHRHVKQTHAIHLIPSNVLIRTKIFGQNAMPHFKMVWFISLLTLTERERDGERMKRKCMFELLANGIWLEKGVLFSLWHAKIQIKSPETISFNSFKLNLLCESQIDMIMNKTELFSVNI